jgi:hypothetical protein
MSKKNRSSLIDDVLSDMKNSPSSIGSDKSDTRKPAEEQGNGSNGTEGDSKAGGKESTHTPSDNRPAPTEEIKPELSRKEDNHDQPKDDGPVKPGAIKKDENSQSADGSAEADLLEDLFGSSAIHDVFINHIYPDMGKGNKQEYVDFKTSKRIERLQEACNIKSKKEVIGKIVDFFWTKYQPVIKKLEAKAAKEKEKYSD